MLDNTSNPMPEVSLEDATREVLIPKLATEEFLADCCVRGEGLQVQYNDLYAAYQSWCTSNEEPQATQIEFSSRLMEIGFKTIRRGANSWRVWEGVELATNADDVLE